MAETITLYYKDGSSDKVYTASIVEKGSGYVVNFGYGRRGNSLTTGTKTPNPVSLDKATVVYNKLIQEKRAKGYTEDTSGKTYSGVAHMEARDTGFRPQLLNEIEEGDLEKYITDPNWCAQEKYDGVRRLIIKNGDEVTGTNRKGQSIALSDQIIETVKAISPNIDFTLDGEAVGDKIYVFDWILDKVLLATRLSFLSKRMDFDGENIILAPTAWTTTDKRALLTRLRAENTEGIVFKNLNAEYIAGRPASGGNQLKFKFVATASVVVLGSNTDKRSINIGVYDDGVVIPVGNVTVYPNQDIPLAGDIVEVRYLYYFPGGSLFQPVLLGQREDMTKEDCTLSQLKAKKDTDE
jgi:bifunctional non-homologous end joining protein LigD